MIHSSSWKTVYEKTIQSTYAYSLSSNLFSFSLLFSQSLVLVSFQEAELTTDTMVEKPCSLWMTRLLWQRLVVKPPALPIAVIEALFISFWWCYFTLSDCFFAWVWNLSLSDLYFFNLLLSSKFCKFYWISNFYRPVIVEKWAGILSNSWNMADSTNFYTRGSALRFNQWPFGISTIGRKVNPFVRLSWKKCTFYKNIVFLF